MGGRCSNPSQFAGQGRLGAMPRSARSTARPSAARDELMPVRVQGRAVSLRRNVPIAELMQRWFENARRVPRTFAMAGAQLDPRRSLWQQGVRPQAQLEVVRDPVPADKCQHDELQYSRSVTGVGYELACPDCDQRGVVSVGLCADGLCGEPSGEADALIDRWRTAPPRPDRCRHPVVAPWTEPVDRSSVDPHVHDYRDTPVDSPRSSGFRCAKCRQDAAGTAARIMGAQVDWCLSAVGRRALSPVD